MPRSVYDLGLIPGELTGYYRIDPFLSQLWLTGGLNGVAGVAYGKLTGSGAWASFVRRPCAAS